MKKLFLTLSAAIAVTFVANAQTEKGKFILGGNVSYDYTSVKDADIDSHSLGIIPSVGYFVSDNFAVGTGIGYAYEKNTAGADVFSSSNTVHAFSVAPFARLYKGDSNFKFFGQLSVPMAWGTAKADDTKLGNIESYGVELAPGFAYFPTSKIGIELSVRGLYYQNSSIKPEEGSNVTTNSFGLNANSLAPRLGVQFYF
ncbi:Outer membrane protein beta-barrel domain-containing protein [Parapedobacter luteus]|uniref:Outer membrane protein beta-barrel domain-containing protein n=1 Tax=Parapedobacter luteus TaxID=623280 RepID=A0A1T5ARK0_9SPHI|nr:outer membrane beta-barrel protein [Parapedobacter luteus]SKB37602.1 Outer membrane protein beta-barrel domain-containing protein [Parapedobacter luteus]